jgi:hypothetical protein
MSTTKKYLDLQEAMYHQSSVPLEHPEAPKQTPALEFAPERPAAQLRPAKYTAAPSIPEKDPSTISCPVGPLPDIEDLVRPYGFHKIDRTQCRDSKPAPRKRSKVVITHRSLTQDEVPSSSLETAAQQAILFELMKKEEYASIKDFIADSDHTHLSHSDLKGMYVGRTMKNSTFPRLSGDVAALFTQPTTTLRDRIMKVLHIHTPVKFIDFRQDYVM